MEGLLRKSGQGRASTTRSAVRRQALRPPGRAVRLRDAGKRGVPMLSAREARGWWRALFDAAPVGLVVTTYDGRVLSMNRRMRRIAGLTVHEALAANITGFYSQAGDRSRLMRQLHRCGRLPGGTGRFRRKDGTEMEGAYRAEEIRWHGEKAILTTFEDVTDRNRNQKHLAGVVKLLQFFAAARSLETYAQSVVNYLCKWCGCEAAGIRLAAEGGCLPYLAQAGFGRQFLAREGELCLKPGGCSCMRILCGHGTPRDLFYTSAQGSYFCNCVPSLANRASAATGSKTPMACVEAGYQSLAHAPLKHRGRLMGTVHLADRRPNRFPNETVTFVESVAPLIGEAIHRFQVEQSLRASEARFRTMFDRHAAVMLLVDPESGAVVDANPAAEAFYGYSQSRLRRMKVTDINTLPPAVLTRKLKGAAGEKGNIFLFPHRLATGEIRTVEVHSSPVDIGGRRLLFSIIHDVTERRLREREVLDVSERERRRVGQDLHDSLGSKLTGVALMSKALAQKLSHYAPAEAQLAEEVVRCVNELVAQTRAIAHGLSPAELSVSGLGGGLVELAAETRLRTGMACQVHLGAGAEIKDVFLATHLFRIAQEAVHNAVRHAGARRIDVRLTRTGADLLLEIADDGQGLAGSAGARSGMGFRSMRHRAAVIGAELTVTSGTVKGTTVVCRLPVRAEGGVRQ